MKNKKNSTALPTTILIIIIAIVIIGSIITIANKDKIIKDENGNEILSEEHEDGSLVNISNKLNEDKSYRGLKFTKIVFSQKDGITSLEAEVTNESGKDIEDFTTVDLVFVNRSGDEIGTAVGIIIPLKKGENTVLSASGTFDYINAYNFMIKEHKK